MMRVGIPRGRSDMSDSEKNSGYAEGLVVYVSWNLEFMLMNGGENKAVKQTSKNPDQTGF